MKFLIFLALARLSWSFFNTTVCSAAQYFDTLTLTCKSCPQNTRIEPKTQQSCICNSNFRKTDPLTIGFTSACTICSGVLSRLYFRLLHLMELLAKAAPMVIMLELATVLAHQAKQSSVMGWMEDYFPPNNV